eukprot:scpid29644/ scgid16318/ 
MMNVNQYSKSDVFMFVRAYCLPSQSTTHAYPVHVCLNKHTGVVDGAECPCVAGLGECCSHAAAVLFRLDDLLSQGHASVPNDTACTDASCKWIVPANVAKVQPVPLDEVSVYKSEFDKQKPKTKKPSLSDFHPVPLKTVKATASRAGNLVGSLRAATPTCPIAMIYDAQTFVSSTASSACPSTGVSELPDHLGDADIAPACELTVTASSQTSELKRHALLASSACVLLLQSPLT